MNYLMKLLTLLVFLFMASCASTTRITVTDPDAKIYVDGEYRGKESIFHTDTKIIGSTTTVTVKKEGCLPQDYTFVRSERFDVGACIGGAFVWVPFLWIQGYKPSRTFEYHCEQRM